MSIMNGLKGAYNGAQANRHRRAMNPEKQPVRYTGDDLFCSACGHEHPPKSETPGSILIELIAWLCFLVPGIIYSIWRISKRHNVCASCGSRELIPPGSPRALSLKKAMSA